MSFDNKTVISKLQQIQKKLEREADKLIVDNDEKFQLEITKSVMDLSSNIIKEKISNVISEEIERFKYIKVIFDYSLVSEPDQVETILTKIEQTKKEILKDTDIEKFNQNIDDFTKRIVLDFPYELGTKKIDEFNKILLIKLGEGKIGS